MSFSSKSLFVHKDDEFIYIFDWCFMLYLVVFDLYDGGQQYSESKPVQRKSAWTSLTATGWVRDSLVIGLH